MTGITPVAGEYSGYFAEFYDAFHPGTPEVPFLVELARRHGARLLELGCGSGRLALPVAKAGLFVTGVDRRPDILSVLRRKVRRGGKAARQNLRLCEGDFHRADVGGEFDLARLACNTFLHALTERAQLRMLRAAGRRIRDGGIVVLDVSVPDLEELARDQDVSHTYVFFDEERDWTVRDEFRAHYDPVRLLETDEIRLACLRRGKLVAGFATRTRLAIVFPRELFHAVARAGFRVAHAFADYARAPWRGRKTGGSLVLLLEGVG